MKKILLLGSVVSPCPPKKQGGTERVAYYQAKSLAKKSVPLIFVGAPGTKKIFSSKLSREKEKKKKRILKNIEFVEIGGGTGTGTQEDSFKLDLSHVESSRKFRIEMVYLSQVQRLMIERKKDYDIILNNMRGEAVLIPLADFLKKKVINVMHLNIFPKLAGIFKQYNTYIITISKAQQKNFNGLNYLATIPNPVNTDSYSFCAAPINYALVVGTIGYHKNQKDAILAAKKAGISIIIAGKIRDADYFEQEIKPLIDNKKVVYNGEIGFKEKLKLYQEAKVFLFPIAWEEPFGLVMIEALSCGTPVIAYPNGGPKEIVKNGVTGFLVKNVNEMAEKIKQIESIKRIDCKKDVEQRFSDDVIAEQYFNSLKKL